MCSHLKHELVLTACLQTVSILSKEIGLSHPGGFNERLQARSSLASVEGCSIQSVPTLLVFLVTLVLLLSPAPETVFVCALH